MKICYVGPKIEDDILLLFVVFGQDKAAFSSSEVQEEYWEGHVGKNSKELFWVS